MGRNSRQRRAAKQKARTRRGPAPPRGHHHASSEEFAEIFGSVFDHGEPTATATAFDLPARRTVTDQAQHLLDRWLAVARRQADPGVLRIWADKQLESIADAVRDRADEILGNRLLADVAGLWNAGWQPRDLQHVAQRIDRRAAVLVAGLAVEQIRRSGRWDLAPEEWREQLETAADQAANAGLHTLDGQPWTPVGRLRRAGAVEAEALTTVLRLLVRIEELPRLACTLPPPSAWRRDASGPSGRPAAGGSAAAMRSGTADGRRDKVLSRIRALLAKAESTDHAAEADTFTAKAQDLMTRHAIDEALLHAGGDESVEVRSHRVLIDNPYPLEKVRLLNEVAAANRVRVIWLEDLVMATTVGTPVDIDQVEMLFVSLLIQATRAMAEAGAARAGSFDRTPTFRRSFLTSYAIRIGERLVEADAEATASYGSELVPVLKRQREAVDEEFERLFPNSYQSSNRRSYDRRGWDAGREAADRATFLTGRIAG
jgi:hypothetical protein